MRENIQQAKFLCGECGHEQWVTFVGHKSKATVGKELSANPKFIAEGYCPSCGAAVEFRPNHRKQYKWEDNAE